MSKKDYKYNLSLLINNINDIIGVKLKRNLLTVTLKDENKIVIDLLDSDIISNCDELLKLVINRYKNKRNDIVDYAIENNISINFYKPKKYESFCKIKKNSFDFQLMGERSIGFDFNEINFVLETVSKFLDNQNSSVILIPRIISNDNFNSADYQFKVISESNVSGMYLKSNNNSIFITNYFGIYEKVYEMLIKHNDKEKNKVKRMVKNERFNNGKNS